MLCMYVCSVCLSVHLSVVCVTDPPPPPVLQVMLGDAEPTKDSSDQLMSEEGGITSKWVAASVQHMMPAAVAGPSSAGAESPDSAAAAAGQSVLLETGDDGTG